MKYLAGALGLVVLGLVGAIVWIYSGFYDIAATTPHLAPTRWAFEVGMREAVEFHARNVDPPPLDDPALIRRGMGHYRTACESCHGAPGVPPQPVAAGLLPEAPNLAQSVPQWKTRELYWIVRHGIKFTGMPAWQPTMRDDEIWAMVAFLRALPDMPPEAYRAPYALAEPPDDLGRIVALAGDTGGPNACFRCHGLSGEGGGDGAFPRLAGQSAAYLRHALQSYASGDRASGIMGAVARDLTPIEIRALADHYADLSAPYPPPARTDPEVLQLGGALAATGGPEGDTPACSSCHGRSGEGGPSAPALAGQPAAYLALQLQLWKTGQWGRPAPDNPMPAIARALSDDEIRAVAAYYAALRPPSQPQSVGSGG